jgi:hypothetical protein
MKNFKRNIYRLSSSDCTFTGTAVELPPSPYSITTTCVGNNIANDYTLTGVPTGATVVVKATFSGYLTRSGQYQANASVSVNNQPSQVSQCIASQGGFTVVSTSTFSAPANGIFPVSAVASNYSSAVGMNLTIELVSVNGQAVGDTVSGCWGNSGGANGCPT